MFKNHGNDITVGIRTYIKDIRYTKTIKQSPQIPIQSGVKSAATKHAPWPKAKLAAFILLGAAFCSMFGAIITPIIRLNIATGTAPSVQEILPEFNPKLNATGITRSAAFSALRNQVNAAVWIGSAQSYENSLKKRAESTDTKSFSIQTSTDTNSHEIVASIGKKNSLTESITSSMPPEGSAAADIAEEDISNEHAIILPEQLPQKAVDIGNSKDANAAPVIDMTKTVYAGGALVYAVNENLSLLDPTTGSCGFDIDPLSNAITHSDLVLAMSTGRYGDVKKSAAGAISAAEIEYELCLSDDFEPMSYDGEKYIQAFGPSLSEGDAWDCAFVCWCIKKAGFNIPASIEAFSSPDDGMEWFESAGRWVPQGELSSYRAKTGDVLFVDIDLDGKADRVDFITEFHDDVYSIIGGDRTYKATLHTISRANIAATDPSIIGIGRPFYTFSGKYFYGIDCAQSIPSQSADALVREGYSFVARYIGSPSASKNIRQAELDMLIEKGLAILLVYEMDTNTAKGGYFTGLTHGAEASKYAKMLGVPSGTTIYFAIDYDAQPEDYSRLRDYFRGVSEAVGDYNVGAYGGYRVVEHLYNNGACDYFWQCTAWSYGKVFEHINAHQYEWEFGENAKEVARTIGLSRVDLDVSNDLAAAGMYLS